MTATPTKESILQALRAFVAQRPGMDPNNYGDWTVYRAESSRVTRDRHHAEALLRVVELRQSIGPADLLAAFGSSGRCTLVVSPEGAVSVDYCTGQYFPTEYRRAVCRGLRSVLWNWYQSNGAATREAVIKAAHRDVGRTIARQWFN